MFLQLTAKQVASWLIQGGSITEEERELYEFGLDKLFSTLTNFIIVMCFGLLLGIPFQILVFYLTYCMLRAYAGGYHADKPLNCFFLSIGAMIPLLVAIRFQQAWNRPIVFYCLLGLGIINLIVLGPVENKNKLLEGLEKTVYRRRLLRNLAFILVGAIVLSELSLYDYSVAVLCGILLSSITAAAGKVKLSIDV